MCDIEMSFMPSVQVLQYFFLISSLLDLLMIFLTKLDTGCPILPFETSSVKIEHICRLKIQLLKTVENFPRYLTSATFSIKSKYFFAIKPKTLRVHSNASHTLTQCPKTFSTTYRTSLQDGVHKSHNPDPGKNALLRCS